MVRIDRILCPIDFSEFSRHAFDRALAIAESHRATVTALHVVRIALASPLLPYVEPATLGPFEMPPAERARIVESLRRFLEVDHGLDAVVAFEAVEAPEVAPEILAQAESRGTDLIVMGTHGRSGFERLMLGSVTEKILRKARSPVLTVPAAAPGDSIAARQPFGRILCGLDFSECAMTGLRFAHALAEESGARLGVCTLSSSRRRPTTLSSARRSICQGTGRRAKVPAASGCSAQFRRPCGRRVASTRSSPAASHITRSCALLPSGAPI
jgi:nucleotide-binding universal stress UspA family protein